MATSEIAATDIITKKLESVQGFFEGNYAILHSDFDGIMGWRKQPFGR